jgi:hypothetical protein
LSYKQTRPNSRGENGNWETTSFTPQNNENLACPLFYHRNFKNGKLRSSLGDCCSFKQTRTIVTDA